MLKFLISILRLIQFEFEFDVKEKLWPFWTVNTSTNLSGIPTVKPKATGLDGIVHLSYQDFLVYLQTHQESWRVTNADK